MSKKSTWDKESDKRKAAYLYLQAVDAFIDDRYSLYGELLDRAYRLDSTDNELAARYGEWMLLTNPNDSASIEKGFSIMMKAYDNMPPDYYEGMQIFNLSNNYRRWNDNLRITEKLHEQFPTRNELALQLGRSYMIQSMMGDTAGISKALKVFDGLEQRVGKSSTISDFKIRTFALKKDTVGIVNELKSLVESSPADSYTALSVGQVYNSLSMPDSALHYFNHACELDSANGNAILTRAQFYQQQGDSTTFDREAFRAIRSQDLELETKMNLMVNYVNMLSQDSLYYQRIDSMFEILLDVNPGEVDVHRLYAEYLARTEDNERAAEQMSYVVSLDRTDLDNWRFLAQLHYLDKQYEKAAEALAEASAVFPEDFSIIRGEAVFYSLADKSDKAIEILEAFSDSTLDELSDRSDYYTLLGDNYYKLKNRRNAFLAYEKAVEANPTNYMAMNNLAYYYAEADTLLDEAEKMIARVVRHQPDNTTCLDTYAWVMYKKKDYLKAKELIDKTLEIVNLDAAMDSIDETISDLVEDGKVEDISEKSETVIEEIVDELEPTELLGSADIYDHAGDIYFRCGLVSKAVEYWQEALAREPENPDYIKAKIKQRKIIENAP